MIEFLHDSEYWALYSRDVAGVVAPESPRQEIAMQRRSMNHRGVEFGVHLVSIESESWGKSRKPNITWSQCLP
jgi:hypothetical protein